MKEKVVWDQATYMNIVFKVLSRHCIILVHFLDH